MPKRASSSPVEPYPLFLLKFFYPRFGVEPKRPFALYMIPSKFTNFFSFFLHLLDKGNISCYSKGVHNLSTIST